MPGLAGTSDGSRACHAADLIAMVIRVPALARGGAASRALRLGTGEWCGGSLQPWPVDLRRRRRLCKRVTLRAKDGASNRWQRS